MIKRRLQDKQSARHVAQQGAAMVIVLWLVLLLSIIATAHARNSRLETALTSRYLAAAESRQIVDAAIELAIQDLLTSRDKHLIPTDGRPVSIDVLGHQAVVSTRPAAGLVDLNKTRESTLRSLFQWAGVERGRAIALAAAVIDWRDNDGSKKLSGAEDETYIAAGLPWTARDGAFMITDELRYVMGMDITTFNRISPYLTVHSGQANIDFSTAPRELVDALTTTPTPARAGPIRNRGGVFHINASVKDRDGVFVSAEVVVSTRGRNGSAFEVLSRRS
jgi:general secretion pathway protein K